MTIFLRHHVYLHYGSLDQQNVYHSFYKIIVFLNGGKLVQAMSSLYVLSMNNLCILVLMYGKKMYIILFKNEKNTKEYFRKKQMGNIEMKSKQLISTPLTTSPNV